MLNLRLIACYFMLFYVFFQQPHHIKMFIYIYLYYVMVFYINRYLNVCLMVIGHCNHLRHHLHHNPNHSHHIFFSNVYYEMQP